MERLRIGELRKVLDVVRELYAAHDLDRFVDFSIAELPRLIPSEMTVFGNLNPPRGQYVMVGRPRKVLARINANFREYAHTHPLAERHLGGGDGSAVKLTDLLTLRELRSRAIYDEAFKPFRLDYEMVVWLPAPRPIEISFALHRGVRDFTERERLLFNLLRPHLIQAYRNAESATLLRRAAGQDGRGIVLLTPEGQIADLDAQAGVWLTEYFGPIEAGHELPQDLARWLRQQERALETADDGPPPLQPLVLEREDRRLIVRLFAGSAQRLLLLAEQRTAADPNMLEPLGLTRREAGVLLWVAEGKKNEEIAAILGLSPRTVAKHVENLMRKLGVETRTAAAARALEQIRPR